MAKKKLVVLDKGAKNTYEGNEVRREKFIENYISGMTHGEAYMAAGYECKNKSVASAAATRLLKDVKIRAEIDKRMENMRESFDRRLSSIADVALKKLPELVKDSSREDSVKMQAINTALKYAGLEPPTQQANQIIVKIIGAKLDEYPDSDEED